MAKSTGEKIAEKLKKGKIMRFHTDFKYTSRKNKPEYVWQKYREILQGRILDVGADECGLKKFLSEGTEYIGIGLGGSVDVEIDLEKEKLPYEDNSFDCVLCLDVLEHLDNIHEVFDELCRVTKKYLIISLPNPWASFMGMLRRGYYKRTELPMKFYNLPTDPPIDRHKWFYGVHEAERFFKERGRMNGMEILQMDRVYADLNLKRRLYRMALKLVVHKDVDIDSLWSGSVWAVLVKTSFNLQEGEMIIEE
jgi:SAM-dependent methyltransferase